MSDSPRPWIVLLVEDNKVDQMLAQEAFDSRKVEADLHIVRDGEEAIAFLRRQGGFAGAPRPDLVLLDLNLPKRNGREVLNAIRADASMRRVPVVIITSSANDDDIYRCYAAGANCYLTKSVDISEHLDLLRSAAAFWLADSPPPVAGEIDATA